MTLLLLACSNPCEGDGALATCLEPTHDADFYAAQSSAYFDTMDYTTDVPAPVYSELAARWEWPPWLILTAYANIEEIDQALVLLPSTVPERDCRGFDTQPFGRCKVTFYYDAHDGLGCPIYEEFIFNDQGEVTWIEAWSDLDGYRPTTEDDLWSEREDAPRLGNKIPGLGRPDGRIDLEGEAMTEAAEEDADVADFVYRANNWRDAWLDELEASGGDAMWETGCGW
jgi:hypothetical protein